MEAPSVLLQQARLLIEKGWCQEHFSTDSDGVDVDPSHPTASCFCSLGAVYAACEASHNHRSYPLVTRLLREQVGSGVTTWNDSATTTRGMVLETFARAESSAILHEGRTAGHLPL